MFEGWKETQNESNIFTEFESSLVNSYPKNIYDNTNTTNISVNHQLNLNNHSIDNDVLFTSNVCGSEDIHNKHINPPNCTVCAQTHVEPFSLLKASILSKITESTATTEATAAIPKQHQLLSLISIRSYQYFLQ